ncbi:MAG: DMT family transporter [Candidatus Hodarchaeales archaeon]
MQSNSEIKNFLLKSSIIVVLWATPPLVSKLWVGGGVFPAFYFGFLRYGLGFLSLLVILCFKGTVKNLFLLIRRKIKSLLFCSFWLVLMIFGQNFSVKFILGSSSSILLNFNPVLIYLMAPMLFSDESYSKRKNIGFVISTIGICIVFFASLEEMTVFDPISFILGNLLGFLSGVGWAGYSISTKWFFQDSNPEEVTTLSLLLAAACSFALSLTLETSPPISSYTIENIFGIAIIGIGAAAIAFTLYLKLIQEYGSIKAGNIQFLIPIISLVLAAIFLREASSFAIIGGIISASGVALVSVERKDKTKVLA